MRIHDGWLSTATVLVSPNADLRPNPADISLLVIHNISLPPGQFGGHHVAELFTNNLDPQGHPYFAEISDLKVSAHLFIDRKGEVTQFVPFHQRAWHAGVSEFDGRAACNDFSIGIELEGADTDSYEAIQYQQLARVSRLLLDYYPSMSLSRITGHETNAPNRKTDPGVGFDWDHFHHTLASIE